MRRNFLHLLAAATLQAAALNGSAVAQQARVPSPAEVLGYELGARFTEHAGVVRYMEALAAASPNVEVRRYGETVEGRPLLQVVIARTDYLTRLDDVLARNRELADPATTEARAREIAATTPAVLYFSYGVHGNESSSSEAAMWTAWDLARGAVGAVLDSAVVVIDPAVNPDGRDRYVDWYRQAVGIEPNPNPESREHVEPWPGGRYNHYLFDLNRDWAWVTQPETQVRLATWDYWTPQVHVDFHEMSPTSSYFFFPATPPINPIYPPHILEWGRYFGAANAAAFDQQGWAYYSAEGFDLFYPGYGDTWPSLQGAIGMTYEQAGGGSAGLVYRRPDGTLLTLRDRAEHHRTTGIATLRAASARKTDLVLDFARFHRTQGQGSDDILLVPGSSPARTDALVALLRAQGIEVHRATRSFRADARPHSGFPERDQFPAGTYRVPARQRRGRLAVTLLQPETVLDATFSYDVSAWSLPFAYGVEAHRVRSVPDAGWQAAAAPAPSARAAAAQVYGYLVPPSTAAWTAVIRYVEAGGRARVLDEAFTIAGRQWPAGAIFLPRGGVADYGRKLNESGVLAYAEAVTTGRADSGHDLGTDEAYTVQVPELALLSGPGTNPSSFGSHWFFLERTAGLKFDALQLDRVPSARLSKYQVMIAPEMSRPDERVTEAVRSWVQAGGTLIAVGSGARSLGATIADIKLREDPEPNDDREAKLERALKGREQRELEQWEQQVPGTILPLTLDPAHPLAFGAGIEGDPARMFVLHTGGSAFEPSESIESVGYFDARLRKTSGVISEQNLGTLERGAWLVTRSVGRGRVILFADDPLFRHFWYSAWQPYLSAILIGPRI